MSKKILYFLIIAFIVLLCIPIPAFRPTYSKSLLDRNGELINANVSSEQQWHLPLDEAIPINLEKAILLYEDEYFYKHLGINPVSVIKSIILNTNEGQVVRGASTLTMQIMRMRNRSKSRSVKVKIYESLAAVKYSLYNRKSKVLKEWCEIAPFGGNTIGVKTAAFRYFKRSLNQMSNAEMALLAILPNTPTTVNLSKNRALLISRRNNLLKKMASRKVITQDEYELSIGEDLPDYPNKVPNEAQHLLNFLSNQYPQKTLFLSTIDRILQNQIAKILEEESSYLQREDINNMAAIVVDVQRNEVVAYVGNVNQVNSNYSYVDIIQSQRSYGSLLKPLLYALALEEATFLPHQFIYDIPTNYGEYRPENFDKKFRGVVPLDDIITQSLNVPSVRLLHEIGQNNFYTLLQRLKIQNLDKGIDHYGLSIILGGGETTPWEISRIYKGLAQNYLEINRPFDPIKVLVDEKPSTLTDFKFTAYSMEHTVEAMSNLSRPREEKSWQLFGYNHKVAWKTGTSYGHKDAWAAGFNNQYQVTVWVGNEIGEGRKDLTGIVRAAPIMFKIFNILPNKKWFSKKPNITPSSTIKVCKETGLLKGKLCSHLVNFKVNKISHGLKTCEYHHISEMGDTILKFHPLVEYYYSNSNPNFKINENSSSALKIVYPYPNLKIYLPKTDKINQNSFLARCNLNDTNIHWYLDNKFIGTTQSPQVLINTTAGLHHLLVIDDLGNRDEQHFEVIEN
jgi:penicillin-binding protein 1C